MSIRAFSFLFAILVYTMPCSGHSIAVDSVELDHYFLHIIDSVIFNNVYYTNLHETDKALYQKECFYVNFTKGKTPKTREISVFSAHDTDFIDKKCVFFKIGSVMFIAKGSIPSNMMKRSRKLKWLNTNSNKGRPNIIPLLATIDDEPGVFVEMTYDMKNKSYTHILDYSIHDIYEVSETDPIYPGGADSMKNHVAFMASKLHITKNGRGVVRFIIEKDGNLSNVAVIRNDGVIEDNVYVEIVMNMPKWIPARHKGKLCRRFMTIPVAINASVSK